MSRGSQIHNIIQTLSRGEKRQFKVHATKYDKENKRLTAQLWLDDNRGDEVIDMVKTGKEIDVSIGAYGTLTPSKGNSNGVEYFYKYMEYYLLPTRSNRNHRHSRCLPASL